MKKQRREMGDGNRAACDENRAAGRRNLSCLRLFLHHHSRMDFSHGTEHGEY